MAWQTPWAPTGDELAACVECGLCLPHCPTFRLTGDEIASPRGRLNAMSAVASGEEPLDGAFAEVMEFCLQCRACEAACPSLVPFGRAMEGARAELAAALGRAPLRRRIAGRWIGRRWLVRLATVLAAVGQRFGARRWLPGRLGRGLRGMRRLPVAARTLVGREFGPSAQPRGTIGLLAGCVMDPWFRGVHEAVVAILVHAGWRVIVPDGQTCCGALATHEGRAGDAERMVGVNREAFAGVDLVVVDAAGCSSHLAESDLGVRSEDVVVTVARAIEQGHLPEIDGSREPVAIQDACHHRHAQRIVDAPRRVVRAAGYEPVEIDPDALCCGAAGLYTMARPQASEELGRRKAAQVRRTGAVLVASSNPGCEIQMRSQLGDSHRVVHPVELYAEALGLNLPG